MTQKRAAVPEEEAEEETAEAEEEERPPQVRLEARESVRALGLRKL